MHCKNQRPQNRPLIYKYDAAGKRISFSRLNPQAELPKAVTAAFNAANQMFSFNDENLSYDANGNLIEKKDGLGTTTYTWDARNQLTEITGPGLSASFKYDAFGRRIEKVINGKAIQYLYDGMDIATEIEGGAIRATYLRSLNIDEVFARVDGNGIRYYQTDGLGSTIGLTDETGVLKTVYSYDPFGNTSVSGELSDNPFQYTGRENDGTGLYYYRARYYSPGLQRFISEDPIGLLGGINFYRYVGNNPVYLKDPSGRGPIAVGVCVALTIGDAIYTGIQLSKAQEKTEELFREKKKLVGKCEADNLSAEEMERIHNRIDEINKEILKIAKEKTKAEIVGIYVAGTAIALFCAASPFLPF